MVPRHGGRFEEGSGESEEHVGVRPIHGRESLLIVANGVQAKVYLLEKWALQSKEGVNRKPSHLRQHLG